MTLNELRKTIGFSAFGILFSARAVFAQDWAAPATSLAESLESGSISIATGVLGIGVIAYGIYTIFSGHFDLRRFITCIAGGALIVIGPGLLRTLLSVSS